MPGGLSGFGLASVAYEGRYLLYVFGGESSEGIIGRTLRYDPVGDLWVTLTPKPTPAADVRAVVIGSRAYVPGGRLSSGQTGRQLEAYDFQRDHWVTLAPMPEPRSAYALAAIEGKLYVIGGSDGSTRRAEVWQYTPDQDVWKARSPLRSPRAFASAAVIDQSAYVIGGEDGSGALALNERYSPAADDSGGGAWTTRAPAPFAVGRGDIAAVGGAVLGFAAGETGRFAAYDAQSDAWTLGLAQLDGGRDLRAVSGGRRVYVLGGIAGESRMSSAREYQAVSTIFLPVVQ
jgi:hypothetical protein